MQSGKVFLRSLWQATVWSHYNKTDVPKRYHGIYTVVLPFKYSILALYGLISIGYPLTSIDFTMGIIYGDLWSFSLMITGLASLIGEVFYPRLLWVEAIALCGVLALMAAYVVCLFWAALAGFENFRFLSLLLVLMFIWMPGWRLWDIVRELRPPANVP